MKAFKVQLIGNTNDYYIITELQKSILEKQLQKNTGFVRIAEDNLRISAIKSITEYHVDLEGCPDYFVNQVKAENRGLIPSNKTPEQERLGNLPTAWIVLDEDMKPVIENGMVLSAMHGKILYPGGERYWYLAKCHYNYHYDGNKQVVDSYITAPITSIAELLKVRDDPDMPGTECLNKRWVYGVHVELKTTQK